ncbi:MAG: methyl-accepting chemotaxis protein, partial [Treponema sp.]|nr:methyl-accepting chemotaxis protein [Treponema sp.]
MKIGKKLIVMIVALTLAGVGILLGAILYSAQKQITALTADKLNNLAENEATKLGLWLESSFSVARSLAQSMEAYESIAAGERRFFYNALLEHQAGENPEIAAIWTCWEPNALDGLDVQYANTPGTDETGRFISYWSRTAGGIKLTALKDYAVSGSGDFYLIPLRTGEETVVEPYFYLIDGNNTLITSLVVPIKKNGTAIGAAGIDIALDKIQANVAAIRPYEGSIASVFSNGGIVAGHFDPSRVGKPMSETEKDTAGDKLPDLIQAVKAGNSLLFSTIIPIGGRENRYNVSTTPLPVGKTATPWGLGLGIPHAIVNGPVLRMLRSSIIISVVMLLTIAAAAFLVARSISTPLGQMVKVVSGLGEGDLTGQLNIKSRDEIGDMAVVFNGTLEKIKGLVLTIKNQSGALFDIGNELAGNMTETAAAINQITANIQSIKNRVINQSASVTETNATMEQITGNIEKLNSHVDRQSDSVAQSSSA